MSQGAALRKINARVKHLQKRNPGKKRVTLQRQAGAEYRAGKLGKVVRMKTRRHKVTKKRKAIVKRVRRLHKAEGRAIRKLGSIGSLKTKLKARLREKLAAGMLSHYQAKTKTAKRKISKRLTVIKKELKNL